MSTRLEFRLLGPVEVSSDQRALPLGGVRQRSVLAILLLHPGEVVPSERLIDLIWDGSPPATAATALQGYVSNLRKAIEPARPPATAPTVIVTAPPGYVIRPAPGQLDLDRFETLAARGREELAAGRCRAAADILAEALGLWRGPALANLRGEPFAQDAIRRLEELRASAVEDQIEARLALGGHREAIPDLEALISADPLRERPRGQLMLALYRSGRQVEALGTFAEARRLLVDELGIEPSDSLRDLHQRILEQDPSLQSPTADDPAPPAAIADATATHARRRPRWVVAAVLGASAVLAAALIASVIGGDSAPPRPPAPPANSLVLLDPTSGEVRATIDVGGTPTSVAVGDDESWVLNADDQTISRVDATTHAVKTFGSGGVPTDLAAGPNALWVGNGKRTRAQFVGPVATSVVHLDATSTAVRGAVRLPEPSGFTINTQQDHLAVAGQRVFAVNPDASLSLIDARTDELTAVIRNVRVGAVAVGDEGVWGLGLDSSLVRIDPRTSAVSRRIRLAANSLSSIAVGAGAVWTAAPYDGTVWRVDPEPRLVERTIDVGVGVSDVAYGMGSVWALNSLRGTVTRIDPRTNRVTARVELGNTPREIAVGAGGVWLTVAGSAEAPSPAAETTQASGALPAPTCGQLFYGGEGEPDRLIVSDLPLRGGPEVPTPQMSEAIAYVLRQREFHAGGFTVGYQACDDSTAQTGIFDPEKCAANAKLFAATPAVIGEIGPYNSGCAIAQIPVANQAADGPLAMISPTNSDVGLTRATRLAPEGALEELYPSGRRNYVRIYPPEDAQAAANARLADDLGAARVAVVSDGGYGETQELYFARAARRLGLEVVLERRWRPEAHGYRRLAAAVGAADPDAVFVSGLLDSNAGRLIKDLRSQLPAAVDLLGGDGLLPISRLFAAAGKAARGMYISVPELPVDRLPPEGRHFVARFAATQAGRPVHPQSVYAAQAAEVMLDAIGKSDGTRASVAAELLRDRVSPGLIGNFGFDSAGDATSAPITIVRARRGGGSQAVVSTEGAQVVTTIPGPPGGGR